MRRREAALLALAVLLARAPIALAADADYPRKPVRLMVAAPPGGGTDVVARIVANGLARSLGKPLVVDNRPGASGIIAAEIVARAAPDGHTVFFAHATFTTIPFLYAKLPYDPYNDFAPVTEVANQPLVLMVNASLPVNTVGELIALAKAKPGTLVFGHTSPGSATHLATEIFRLKTGTSSQLTTVSYKGAALAQVALMSGEIQATMTTLPAALPNATSTKVKLLAISGNRRLPDLANVPTFVESGVKGVDVAPWQGLMVPARTPKSVIDRLHAEVVKLLQQPADLQRLAATGSQPVGSSPAEFRDKIKREFQELGAIIKASGLKPQ